MPNNKSLEKDKKHNWTEKTKIAGRKRNSVSYKQELVNLLVQLPGGCLQESLNLVRSAHDLVC